MRCTVRILDTNCSRWFSVTWRLPLRCGNPRYCNLPGDTSKLLASKNSEQRFVKWRTVRLNPLSFLWPDWNEEPGECVVIYTNLVLIRRPDARPNVVRGYKLHHELGRSADPIWLWSVMHFRCGNWDRVFSGDGDVISCAEKTSRWMVFT